MEEYSDKELLEKFRDENTRSYAFNLLVKKYQKRLYNHIRRMLIDHDDSNDVLQNVLLKMWNNLLNFKEDSQLFTWLYRIATNESLTFLKKKRTKFFIPIVDVEYQLSKSLEDDNYFNGDEIQLKLQKAILTLPEKQRLVFNMKYYEDFKYEAMSDVLGTSVGALKASYHIAVKKIEEYVLSH
ncbi:MAG: sigma-70 family RNA polymerase sigma factor [Bacteroidetes bacterium]|nr:sigma-70 family RNA polymerase sigma factor [Bacteroidota bacterium]